LFTINYLSCFAYNPGKTYWEAMKHAIAYVKNTINYGIIYHHRASLQLVDFVESNCENNQNTRRSIYEHAFYVRRSLLSWLTKRQNTVATLTTETEYITVF